jgi:hypothetical protein
MQSIYKKLFTVKVNHTFYASGSDKDDVILVPTRECRQLIGSGKMLFRKNVGGGISVHYKVLEEGSPAPFIAFDQDKYVFGIELGNKAKFLNITDLDNGSTAYRSGKVLYFRNNGTQSSLIYELLDGLRPAVFTYEFAFASPAAVSPASGELTIKNANDITVFSKTGIARDPNGIYKLPLSFDALDLPKGKYKFQYKDSSNTIKEEIIYIDSDLARQGIVGVVEISSIGIPLASFVAVPAFTISFTRQETLWRYYVVLKSGQVLTTDTLAIADLAGDDTNSTYLECTFSSEGLTNVSGIDAFSFISDQLIPFFEEPKMNLKLVKTTSGTVTLIKNLPNPSSSGSIGGFYGTQQHPVSEVFIYV